MKRPEKNECISVHERGIMFRGELVRAILAGRKTQTRRVVNLDNLRVRCRGEVRGDGPFASTRASGVRAAQMNRNGAVSVWSDQGTWLGVRPGEFDFVCPYADGDTHLADLGNGRKTWTITPRPSRLWVRETWQTFRNDAGYEILVWRATAADDVVDIAYPDGIIEQVKIEKWRPSLLMPRIASRITLRVASVRVERVQDITSADAIAEGISAPANSLTIDCDTTDPRDDFRALWDRVSTGRAKKRQDWAANPWVWAITFERIDAEAARAA